MPQLKVMSAIENCRTAALGGQVAACTKCDHQHIAYNSCRNRHCPKCQGAAAQDWMQARMEDLLPVQYFHGLMPSAAIFTNTSKINITVTTKSRNCVFFMIKFREKHPGQH